MTLDCYYEVTIVFATVRDSDKHPCSVFSELTFTFAICYRPSVCRLSSVCLSSVTFVRPTQAVEIFGNISTALGTWPSIYIH